MTTTKREGDSQAIIDAVERLANAELIGLAGTPMDLAFAVLPEGQRIESLKPMIDELLDAPRRIETTAGLTTVDSFINYANRFKTDDTAIFVKDDADSPSILGVVDFHGQGDAASPRFLKHRISYRFPLSDQIKAWKDVSGKPLSHQDFATFLQDRQFDISNPPLDWMMVDKIELDLIIALLNLSSDKGEIDDGALKDDDLNEDGDYIPRSALYKLRQIRFGSAARLIQMARTVEVSSSDKAIEGYNPKTGERIVTFTEEHETRDGQGRKVIVPDVFLLNIPIFEGETPQLIPVRLQYRKSPAGLKWFVSLIEWARIVRIAVRAEAERVNAETDLPVFYGQP